MTKACRRRVEKLQYFQFLFQVSKLIYKNAVIGGIRLIVGFQPLMAISPTASWIRWCMQVYVCELMWTGLVWDERYTPDSFWVPNHQFNSATGEQKGITQTIYTDSEPPSRLPNSLMPSAKLRSANLPVFLLLVGNLKIEGGLKLEGLKSPLTAYCLFNQLKQDQV